MPWERLQKEDVSVQGMPVEGECFLPCGLSGEGIFFSQEVWFMEGTEKKIIRWGILGAGSIVDRWIKGARQVEDMEIAAIASRTPETAQKMAQKHGIPEAVTYEQLVSRDDIDVVYVPVPHTAHKELTIQALKAGKAVLVEKPAAVTAADFADMAACAKENHTFLMEAVWTRFFPIIGKIREYLGENGIGDVRLVQTAFAFRAGEELIRGRLADPMTAGGSLLDTGVYDFHFTDMILDKEPQNITGLASFDTDEYHLQVDEQASWVVRYDKGELAVMTSAIRTTLPDTAFIYGTKGSIEVPVFWKPSRMIVRVYGKEEEQIEMPIPQKIAGMEDEGYQFEVEHVNDCLRCGLTESPVMTFEKSLRVLRQCDSLRDQWNFRYPFE